MISSILPSPGLRCGLRANPAPWPWESMCAVPSTYVLAGQDRGRAPMLGCQLTVNRVLCVYPVTILDSTSSSVCSS